MSVTFWLSDAELVENGETLEVNMSNANAWDFMTHVDPEAQSCDGVYGEWPVSRLPEIRARLIALVNTSSSAVLQELPSREGNIFNCGRDAEYVQRRLLQFLNLTSVAAKVGTPVCFG
jgi:hypothetical protein